jgi:uncharacterized protein (DUF302 family)
MPGNIAQASNGVIGLRSSVSFANTVSNLCIALERRGMAIYARADHAANASAAGLELRPAQLFVFGVPEVESPIIARCPALGLDLPRKIAVWEDEAGNAWIGYNDPLWLGRRYSANADVLTHLRAVAISLSGIALEAGGHASQPGGQPGITSSQSGPCAGKLGANGPEGS